MKIAYLLCTVAFLLSINNGFAEDHTGRITKPVPTENGGRIRRPVVPAEETIGLNGSLKWKKDKEGFEYLTLVTLSGMSYELITNDIDLQKKLTEIAGKKFRVEVSGIVNTRGGVSQLKLQSIDKENLDNNGEYIIGLKEDITRSEVKQVLDALNAMPTTTIVALTVKTDLSQEELQKQLRDRKVDGFIRYIEPNVTSYPLSTGIE